MSDTPASFGYLVRRRRKALDLTQEELASRVGCSPATIRKIENDERRPSKQVAELLAQTLEIQEQEKKSFIQAARADRRLTDNVMLSGPVGASEITNRPRSLPQPVTSFIGRELELYQLLQLLLGRDCRLVTLLGPSGIGKTRLAIEAGHKIQARRFSIFHDGVLFIPLEHINSKDDMVKTIAECVGLVDYRSEVPQKQLVNFLSEKQLLLILDNLEHLLSSADLISEILQNAAGVKVLATSSERLNVQGEWVVEIQGLPTPLPGQGEDITESSAVQLFLQSAQRLQEDFTVTPENRESIGEICRLVEGMPLGIVLAASWVRSLSVETIAQEIRNDINFLSTSSRDLPERQRSMRAVFEHTWKLLSPSEQQILRRLAVFEGGFDLRASKEVSGAAISELAQLIEKSLLHRSENGRFYCQELVRQFAQYDFHQEQEVYRATRKQHSRYYLKLLSVSIPILLSDHQQEILSSLSTEEHNLRFAWEFAVEREEFELLAEVSFAMLVFHEFSNTTFEAEQLFRRTLHALENSGWASQHSENQSLQVWGALAARNAWMKARQGHIEESLPFMRKAIECLRKGNNQGELANGLYHSAIIHRLHGNHDDAIIEGLEACKTFERQNKNWHLATLTCVLGQIEYERGNYEEAQRLLGNGLTLSRKTGNPRAIVFAINSLCHILKTCQKYNEIEQLLQEAIHLIEKSGDRYDRAMLLEQIATVYEIKGDSTQALLTFEESSNIYRIYGDTWSRARILNQMASILERLGADQQAFDLYTESHNIATYHQIPGHAMDAQMGIATLSARKGDKKTAIELANTIFHHPATPYETKLRARHVLEETG